MIIIMIYLSKMTVGLYSLDFWLVLGRSKQTQMTDVGIKTKDEWTTVTSKKKESNNKKQTKKPTENEKLLDEEESMDTDCKDIEEEITLIGSKNAGHRRTGPHGSPECVANTTSNFPCDKCTLIFKSDVLLQKHVKNHMEMEKYPCELCLECFGTSARSNNHMTSHQTEKEKIDEWLCNDCDFHGACAVHPNG